jgi:hypothetical protein
MTMRAAGNCWIVLLAVGCSDGMEPALPANGVFTGKLTGARTFDLAGSASAGIVYIETGSEYVVRMFDPVGDEVRGIIIGCQGDAIPELGPHALGPGADCHARYSRFAQSPSPGSTVAESAEAVSGTVTVTRAVDEEFAGRFTFQGELLTDTDTVGPLAASGTFRAVRYP